MGWLPLEKVQSTEEQCHHRLLASFSSATSVDGCHGLDYRIHFHGYLMQGQMGRGVLAGEEASREEGAARQLG